MSTTIVSTSRGFQPAAFGLTGSKTIEVETLLGPATSTAAGAVR